MPAAVFGIPSPSRGAAINRIALVSQNTTANVEYVLPDTTFTLAGPTQVGALTMRYSGSKNGVAKLVTFRIYRDGVVIGQSLPINIASDATDGNQATFVFRVPPQSVGSHLYYVTWALGTTTTGADGLYSAWRIVSVLPDLAR